MTRLSLLTALTVVILVAWLLFLFVPGDFLRGVVVGVSITLSSVLVTAISEVDEGGK